MSRDRLLREARDLDRGDPLASFRQRFFDDATDTIYLDGNSLGRMPADVGEVMSEVLAHQWGSRLIRSWNERWLALPDTLAAQLARLLGSHSDEILVGDSTSINLFKLAFATLKLQQGRGRIVTDCLNFPSDRYILQGLIDQHFPNHRLVTVGTSDGITIDAHAIRRALDTDTALVSLSHVAYKSAFLYDMKEITDMAHQVGALVIWDVSHSAGSVPIDLNHCQADMAVGCTYKYLNGGPGAPAFLYVRRDLQDALDTPIPGWFGHAKPFAFATDYEPDRGLRRFAVGTPHILSLVPLECSLDLLLQAGLDRLREKSVTQTEFLLALFRSHLEPLGFELGSPTNPQHRGAHFSLRHPHGYQINQAMIRPKGTDVPIIIPDFRPPDMIRMGLAPLTTSFEDIYRAAVRLRDIVEREEYLHFSATPSGVT